MVWKVWFSVWLQGEASVRDIPGSPRLLEARLFLKPPVPPTPQAAGTWIEMLAGLGPWDGEIGKIGGCSGSCAQCSWWGTV